MGKDIQTNYDRISCFEVINRWIDKYFDGEVETKTALKMDRHLQECERCNRHYGKFLG